MPFLKIALIGVGGFGANHLKYLSTMERRGNVRLVAVADPFRKSLVQQSIELEARGVRWYLDYRELLCSEQLDCIVVATPIHLHEKMVQDCIAKRLYVLLEKPPVPLLRQIDQLVLAKGSDKVAVGFQGICSREIRLLKRWIVDGELGTLRDIRVSCGWPRNDEYYGRASWAGKMVAGGLPVFDGPATNALSHLVHASMFLANTNDLHGFAEPEQIEAEYYRARPINSYDVANLRGCWPGEVSFTIALAHAVNKRFPSELVVTGSKCSASLIGDGKILERAGKKVQFSVEDDPFISLYENFFDFVEGNIAYPATSLIDSRGYLLAVNGGLVSSNGIRTIGSEYISRSDTELGRTYNVDHIDSFFQLGVRISESCKEEATPWRKAGNRINLKHLSYHDVDRFFENPIEQ